MRPTTSTATRLLPAALAAVVATIVLGILGMHALSTHTVMSHNMTAPMTGPMTAPMTGHVDGIRDAGAAHGSATAAEVFAAGPAGSGHAMGDMVMLCVFMLAAAGALLLALTAPRRTPRPYATSRASTSTFLRLPRLRAATGPPPAWEFSVIRC